MPTTINGIGTHYYSKTNLEKLEGVCEQCNKACLLSNYETRLWFVVIFIPIIPLGRKMILSDCSHCRQHYVMPLDEWEEIKKKEIEGSANQFSQNQDHPASAIKMFDTLLSFNKQKEAEKMSKILESNFPNDVDVQMTLGAWHEREKRMFQADQCFEKAFAIDPDNPAPRRAVGVGMIQNGEIKKADELFTTLLPPSNYYDPVLFYLLGKGYQGQGDHEQAMKQFEMIAKHSSEWLSDSTFRKVVKASEKMLGRTESILPKKWFGLFG